MRPWFRSILAVIAGFLVALLFGNAAWHMPGAVRTRSYSRGIFTGLLLYVPLAVYGYARFLHSRQAAISAAIIAFAVGASYQFWAPAVHTLRAKRKGA